MKPSDYLRPHLVPGSDPFTDDYGVVHVLDVASVREVAEGERRRDFSMGAEWLRAVMAQQGVTLPERLMSVWYFPWSAAIVEPDQTPGRWHLLHGILKEYLTKDAVRELSPYITALATRLIRESVAARLKSGARTGEIDLAHFADQLAFHTMSELAGFPHEPADAQFMMEHLAELASRPNFVDAFRPESPEVGEYIEVIINRHRGAGRAGLLGRIIEAYDRQRITKPERDGLILGCWSAGRDTTATLTALLFGLLDEAGQVQTMLASLDDKGERWRNRAIREAQRFAPFPYNPTVSMRDVTLANGFRIPKLSVVNLHWAAANRDPAVFGDDAGLYRPERPFQRNFGFGHGVHYCLGELLALTEVDIAARTVYGSLPGLRMTAWRRRAGLVDTVETAVFEYDLKAAAQALGLQ